MVVVKSTSGVMAASTRHTNFDSIQPFCYVPLMAESTASGPNEFQRFRTLLQAAVSVPKSEIDRREADYKKRREQEKRAKK